MLEERSILKFSIFFRLESLFKNVFLWFQSFLLGRNLTDLILNQFIYLKKESRKKRCESEKRGCGCSDWGIEGLSPTGRGVRLAGSGAWESVWSGNKSEAWRAGCAKEFWRDRLVLFLTLFENWRHWRDMRAVWSIVDGSPLHIAPLGEGLYLIW